MVEFSKSKIEWALLITGVICALLSIFMDADSAKFTTWFARSGSLIVLVAAIVEYRLSSHLYEDIYKAAKETARKKSAMPDISNTPLVNELVKSNLTLKPEVPRSRKILSGTSDTLVIVGTIIWGYGDLWVC
jgi:hypothetical protein